MRESGLALRDVPIVTAHTGMISAPRVGDLVLLSYINGDPNNPVITGRLYSDQSPPPAHGKDDLLLQAPYKGKTSINIGADQSITITAGTTDIVIHQDGSIYINAADSVGLFVTGDVNLECENASIEASGNIDLGLDGGGVVTTKSHKCFFTGAPLVGSTTVKAKS